MKTLCLLKFCILLKLEIFSEVAAASFGMGDELVYGSREKDFALLDKVASVDDRENLAGVVIGDQDADLFLF